MTSRRDLLRLGLGAGLSSTLLRVERLLAQGSRPVPSPSQLTWQQDELAIFIHFGVNTFTNREWGDGKESPAIFNPTKLDANQWASTARRAGFKAMVLTAKHHDGFCLWPTKTTTHSVASSPFRGGQGDVVREFVDACRRENLRVGLYCSPWDRNAPAYGDSPRYNDMFVEQLTELLTQYGPVHEVWFDGANGEGPNGKRQEYDWPRFWGHVRRLQPDAVMFSDAGPDVRWIGNERGVAGDTNWSTVDPAVVPVPGMSGDAVMKMLQDGDPRGTVWRPGETDVSIRPGWFYHPAEDARVKSIDQLVELYFTSVGRNSKLLLNVPPTPEGLLHDVDVERLLGMRRALDRLFANEQPSGAQWSVNGNVHTVTLRTPVPVSILDAREDVRRGQVVARHVIEGANGNTWTTLARGTTIGYKRLHRIPAVTVDRLRLTVEESLAEPQGVSLRAWHPA
ncbi:MAG TPA: alpha-L-fucosidase [Gemmatimonadaceae bacterium]